MGPVECSFAPGGSPLDQHQAAGQPAGQDSRIELRATEDDRDLLADRRLLAGFHCRSEEQTAWLVELAKQALGIGTTRVFVVTEVNRTAVVAYYACCLAVVYAESVQARSFFEQLIPAFSSSPTDPLHLLLLKDIRRTLGR